jgi:hypothetical protein
MSKLQVKIQIFTMKILHGDLYLAMNNANNR